MTIITKTEICDNVPVSLPPLTFGSLIGDMKRIESLSTQKLLDLERRLQAAENESRKRRKENDKLKSDLAAKERDCKLYYDQYQKIAGEFEEFKTTHGKDVEQPKISPNHEDDLEPAMVVYDTDSEPEENPDETILFNSPELFLEPATLGTPIPKANSTALPTLDQCDQAKNLEAQLTGEITAIQATETETSPIDMLAAEKMPETEEKKCSIIKTRKRARSESITKSGVSNKKARIMLPTPTDFKCRSCPKLRFPKIDEYRDHVKQTHHERKVFCDLCPFTCRGSAEMERHYKLHTTVYDHGYDCKLCEITFSMIGTLKKHITVFH